GDDDDSSDDDEEEEEASEEEEDEHLASADSVIAPERLTRCLVAPALPSSPLPIVPHPYGSPSHVRAPLGFRAVMASLFIPPVDRREDTPKAKLPPRKRLCLTAPAPRYEVGESSMAGPRPAGGHGGDYGFIGTVDAKVG
ncbi:hypothetical protein Tco_1342537, partial [Tanacetum coccineum]